MTCWSQANWALEMSAVSWILQEVESANAFFKGRTASDPSSDAALKDNFTKTIIKQIGACKVFGKAEATALQDKLKEQNPYGPGLVRIQATIDAKLGASANVLDKKDNTPGQKLHNPWKWYTSEDWDVFRDHKKHWTAKCSRAVERPMLVGCSNPDEPTLGKILAVLCGTHYTELPSAKVLYDKLQDLKQCVAAERKAFPHEQLQMFPASPYDLPEHIFEYAYSEGAPVDVQMPGINTIVASIPLRKNSRLLKGTGDVNKSQLLKVKQEFCDLKNALVGEEAVNSIVLLQDEGASKMHAMPALKKFKQERSDEAIEWDDLPKNVAEKVLYCKYKADLWKLRAEVAHAPLGPNAPSASHKREGPLSPVQTEPGFGTLAMRTDPDGSLVLNTRVFDTKEMSLKNEPATATVPVVKQKPAAAIKEADDEPTREEDVYELDEHSAAALKALQTRNVKKKASQKEAKKAAKQDAANVQKKPAAKPEAVVKYEGKDAPKIPKFPKDGNPPVTLWKGGAIYSSVKKQCFRGLREAGDGYTEIARAWGAKRSKEEAWGEVVTAIASHSASKKAKKAKK